MSKNEAIKFFGSVGQLADALSISRQAIYQWPNDLPVYQVDRIFGAALRLGVITVKSEKDTAS